MNKYSHTIKGVTAALGVVVVILMYILVDRIIGFQGTCSTDFFTGVSYECTQGEYVMQSIQFIGTLIVLLWYYMLGIILLGAGIGLVIDKKKS